MTAIDLLITSGNGPTECRIAVKALLDILQRQARENNCLCELNMGPMPDAHGPKSALLNLEGEAAAQLAGDYCGTVKFLFKSPVRPGHKRQNWFVSVQKIDLDVAKMSKLMPRTYALKRSEPEVQAVSTRTPPIVPCVQSTLRRDYASLPEMSGRNTATRLWR